jgi:exodeoxyribonuclease VII small subunit
VPGPAARGDLDQCRPKMTAFVRTLHLMHKANPKTPASPVPASYEAGLQELEKLLADMESGQLPLDQLLSNYQRGAELLSFCRDRLQAVEQQVKLLEDGVLKPWTPPS